MSAEEIRERAERLERRAKVVRSRLLRAVDALDERRHQVERITKQAKSMALPALGGTLAVLALFGLSAACFSAAIRRRRVLTVSDRAAEFLRRAELVPRPSFARTMGEKLALSLVSFAATELAHRATKNFVDGRLPDGRIAVRPALEAHRLELKTT